MYNQIFLKIENKNFEFSEKEKTILENLQKDSILILNNSTYELNSKFKVGVLVIGKNKAFLEDFSNEHKNISLDFSSLNGAYDGDIVLAKRVFNPRSKVKAKIIKVLESKQRDILLYVKDKAFYTMKESIKVQNDKSMQYNEGDVILVNNKDLSLVKHLGNIKDAKIDELISLYLYNETQRLNKNPHFEVSMNDTNKRVDLRDLDFCTIDPNSAKDHDDAIYYDSKEKVLFVAIADVSYFVKEGSDLDKLAYTKSTSLYLPGKVLPMLPNELSEDLCSLKEGVDRYAFVFKIYLDLQNNEVKKSELFEAIINSKRKYSYGRIDRVLEGKLDQYSADDKRIFDSLITLYEVTKSFRAKRLKIGYDFRSVELRQKLKNYKLDGIDEEHSSASHQLIEECMLLANIEASKKVNSVGIYRIHEEPSFKDISSLVDDVNSLGIKVKLKDNVHSTITHIQERAKSSVIREEVDELIIQSQTQAKYSSKNLGHFGLGFKSYSHFTSPIRRYADLVLHRILKSKQTPNNIDDICLHISTNERKIDELVWDFEDRKYARWAKDNIGVEIKAKITDTIRSRAKSIDKIKGMNIVLDNYKGQALFTKVKVKIKEVDLFSKVITASIKY